LEVWADPRRKGCFLFGKNLIGLPSDFHGLIETLVADEDMFSMPARHHGMRTRSAEKQSADYPNTADHSTLRRVSKDRLLLVLKALVRPRGKRINPAAISFLL
jgi:hypothetical protein